MAGPPGPLAAHGNMNSFQVDAYVPDMGGSEGCHIPLVAVTRWGDDEARIGSHGEEDLVRLYFAGPLFSVGEAAFNAQLAALIEQLGFEVYLPQRDGWESSPETVGSDLKAQAIFDLDRDNVLASDVLLCVLDGRVPDEGMAVELGLAYADRVHRSPRRRLIGYSTDPRHRSSNTLNAMLVGALDEIYYDQAALLERLKAVLNKTPAHSHID